MATDSVQMLTTAEFEEWSKDAETLSRICICTKREALSAIFQLREQELGRDLTPLLKLVDENLCEERHKTLRELFAWCDTKQGENCKCHE